MIRRLNKNAHVAEIHGCVDRIVRIWGEYPALAKRAILSDIMQSLATENSVFLASINREKVVSSVKEYDDKRDEAIKNLSLAIDGMTVLPDVDKESALVLKKIFAKFGKKITALNRTAESTKIASLLQEFSSAEAVKALEALPQIKTMISALEAAEEEFQKEVSAYDVAKKKKDVSASTQKEVVLKLLNDKLVSFATLVYDDEEESEFAHRVESEILKVNTLVSDRNKKKESV